MTKKNWTHLFPDSILEKGEDYADNGAVKDLKVQFENQYDTFIFQQQMGEIKKVKKEWKDAVNPIISVLEHKDK